MSRFFSSRFSDLTPYTPGEQPRDRRFLKLNTNESPFPVSTRAASYASENLRPLQLYSDPECVMLREKIAGLYGVDKEEVVIANGSDEILNFAFAAFCDESHPAAFADITYGFYPVFAAYNRVPFTEIPLKDDFSLDPADYMGIGKTVFIANPNAPTGMTIGMDDIERICDSNPDNVVVIDEAYVDFGGESAVKLIHSHKNLMVTQTFSKSRSMAGARLGFGIADRSIIGDINTLRYSTNPYNINSYSMILGTGVLEDEEYTRANCRKIMETRERTVRELKDLGFETTDSKANFIFARTPDMDGGELYERLKAEGVLIRHFTKERICQYNRITVGTDEQMEELLRTLRKVMDK